jgi:hypothetical protein
VIRSICEGVSKHILVTIHKLNDFITNHPIIPNSNQEDFFRQHGPKSCFEKIHLPLSSGPPHPLLLQDIYDYPSS